MTGELTARDVAHYLIRTIPAERERFGLEAFGVDTIAAAAAELDEDLPVPSRRTIRRVLEALTRLGELELVDTEPHVYHYTGATPSRSSCTSADAETSSTESTDSGGRRRIADISVTDLPAPTDPDVLIYHLFADIGVEAEPLSAYGEVIRVGIDPQRTRFGDVVRGDALEAPLKPGADLVVIHPPCQRWSPATPEEHRDEYVDLIDEARSVAIELGEDYILENVPRAPLADPVELEGRMFGLPIVYRRAFETSFSVPQPESRDQTTLLDRSGPFAGDDGGVGDWRGSKRLWRTAKQVTGDYPSVDLKHAGIPAPYIHYLVRYWLRSRPDLVDEDDRTVREPTDPERSQRSVSTNV